MFLMFPSLASSPAAEDKYFFLIPATEDPGSPMGAASNQHDSSAWAVHSLPTSTGTYMKVTGFNPLVQPFM